MSHNWKLINMPDAVELNQLPFIFTHWLLTNDCNKNVWLNGFFLVGSGKMWNISELFHLWWPLWDARLNISDPLSMVTQKTTHFGICLWSMIPFFFSSVRMSNTCKSSWMIEQSLFMESNQLVNTMAQHHSGASLISNRSCIWLTIFTLFVLVLFDVCAK